jgi:hypothetical protein
MALPNLENQNIQDTYQRVVQTDGNKVYDGTGSLLPIEFNENNVIISGTLTAQSYIVSESITSVSSGSTIFGNSQDDIHQITGSLKVTGSITLGYNQNILLQDQDGNENDFLVNNYADSLITIGDADSKLKLVGGPDTQGIGVDLSGTGTVLISHLLTTSTTQLGNQSTDVTSISGSISAVTNITASSDISASGTVSANKLFLQDGEFDINTGNKYTFNPSSATGKLELSVGGDDITFDSNKRLYFKTDDNRILFDNSNITSSGNISSSGDLIGSTVHALQISSSGDVVVGDNIIHNEDPDTKIGFGPNLMAFQAGGENFMSYTYGAGTPFNLDSFETTNVTATGTISAAGGYGTIDGGSF